MTTNRPKKPRGTPQHLHSSRVELPFGEIEVLRVIRRDGAAMSPLLSRRLLELFEAGWSVGPMARALGISKQSVHSRVQKAQKARAELDLDGAVRWPWGAGLLPPVPPPPGALSGKMEKRLRLLASRAQGASSTPLDSVARLASRRLNLLMYELNEEGVPPHVLATATGMRIGTIAMRLYELRNPHRRNGQRGKNKRRVTAK